MKIVNMTKYRLHRYFYSSRPALPLIATAAFLGIMYSMKPVDVCSGYILSGLFQFVLMTFVTLSMSGSEEPVEEHLILFHGKSRAGYYMARELTFLVISFIYGMLLIVVPVIQNSFNRFSLFIRTISAGDVAMGAMIIIGSGFAGIAIGDVLHPRIMGDRKLAVVNTVGIIILSIAKDAVIHKYRFLLCFGILLPSVMKPTRDFSDSDYFEVKAVLIFLIMMTLYYFVVVLIKNLILNRKKFS